MFKKIALSVTLILLTTFSVDASEKLPNTPAECIDYSANKFGVPADVLRSIIISDTKYKVGINGLLEAKPFEFHIANKKILSEKGGFDWDNINKSTCYNYNAVAWYLMNVSGGNKEKDIWEAVKRFYFGNNYKNYKNKYALSNQNGYNPYNRAMVVYKEITGSNKSYHEKYNLWNSSTQNAKVVE